MSLVLVESVTGNVPLVGESPLGTLGIRNEEPIRAPVALGPLGPVIERAGQVSPDDRYPDAPTMGAALDDVIRVLPPPGPLTLAGLGEAVPDPHPTQVVTRPPVFDQDEATKKKQVPVPARAAASDPERSRTVAPIILAAVLVLLVAGAVFALTRPADGATVAVPNLQGLDENAAQTAANQSGLLVSYTERTADDPAGMIVAQSPKSGYFLGRGGTVKLVVSKGPKPVKLPPVLMRAWTEAKTMLEQAQYAVTVERQYNETAPKEAVVATEPAGKAPPDTTVKLVVSDGPAPVQVPNVARLSYEAAAAQVQDNKLSPRRVEAFDDNVPKGQVIRTDPPSGAQAPRDSAVSIVVSKGPDLVIVPDLTKKTIDEATRVAQATGLTVTVQGAYSPGKKVRAQDWPKGTPVKRGLLVTLFF